MQPILRSRVLPRISFRAMMLLTGVAAVIATIARAAGGGAVLAKALLAAVVLGVAFFLLAIGSFMIAWLVARMVHHRPVDALQGNPFAEGNLPPQHIKPREPVQ